MHCVKKQFHKNKAYCNRYARAGSGCLGNMFPFARVSSPFHFGWW